MLDKLRKFLRERRLSKLVVSQELGRYEKPIYHLSKKDSLWKALCGEDAIKAFIPIDKFPVGSNNQNCKKCSKYVLGGA